MAIILSPINTRIKNPQDYSKMVPIFVPLTLLLLCSSAFAGNSKDSTSGSGESSYVMNQIDNCWRWNMDWADNRQDLADCAIGFGRNALGGKGGNIYVVNDSSDDPVNPKPGTLRWGVIQEKPLWIIFEKDMSLAFERELMVNSYKTIDGRGAKVEITKGARVTLQDVSHVIIHGISIHDTIQGPQGMVASSTTHVGQRLIADGDAIDVMNCTDIWIDHCSFGHCLDGLVDIIHASTDITVSNCYFSDHSKVMLLGHDDSYFADVKMKVTVVYNHFGPGLVQRMPRVRHGYAHVANNKYDEWLMYAIGGSANPTILSQGNYFCAGGASNVKEVTKRENTPPGWKTWKWRSSQDVFKNGAFFVPTGFGSCAPVYSGEEGFVVMDGTLAPMLTASSGVLTCTVGSPCVNF